MTGPPKAILHKKFSKIEIDDVTRDPEDLITEIKLLRGDLRKLGVIIDDMEMITQLLSNLPE